MVGSLPGCCARRERQYGDRAAKQRDELASFPNRPPNLPERE
jgi:hypothetical protein